LKRLRPQQRNLATDEFHEAAIVTQLKQLTGNTSAARKAVNRAFELLDDMADEFTPMFEYEALAARSALRLPNSKTNSAVRKRAEKFFDQKHAAGFAVYADVS
jgi:hypothetical protein